MTGARLILLCGLPGSGKTTTARAIAAERPAVRLSPDEWLERLGVGLWNDQVRDRLETLLWELAQDLLRLGQTVILESGGWRLSERTEKRLAARSLGAAVELHYLEVPVDELWSRIQDRNTQPPWDSQPITREHLDLWVDGFEAPLPDEIALFQEPPS